MALNLDQNKDNLVSAWREVMDEKCPTDWALFGYDGQTFDLNLVSKGDGGLEELNEDFNSGKIMYALCRVKVKEKNVEKIILINWQGEGANLARKGVAANHLGVITHFFKGIHVTINARTDEDVEPEAIISHVSKSTAGDGIRHSTIPSGDQAIIGPVGTVYKKVNAKDDINSAAKDEFWRLEEQEEDRRKKEEKQKFRKFSQNEVKLLRRESQEYFHERDEPVAGSKSLTNPSSQKLNNGGSNGTSSLNSAFNTAKDAAVKSSTPLKSTLSSSGNSSGDLVRQRIKSFDTGTPRTPISSYTSVGSATTTTPPSNGNKTSIISSSTSSNSSNNENDNDENVEKLSVLKRRQLFENVTTSSYSPPLKSSPAQEIKLAQEKEKAEMIKQQQQPQQQQQPKPISNPIAAANNNNSNNISSSSSTSLSSKVDNNNAFNTVAKSPTISPSSSSPASIVPQVQKSISPTPPPPIQAQTTQETRSNGVKSSYEHNNTQVVSNNGYTAHGGGAGDVPYTNQDYNNPKANYISNNEPERVKGALKTTDQKHLEQEPPVIDRTSTPTIEITPEMGTCARALYDYQAADDSEISFDPGQVITNIEQIDEGWWEGLGPDGIYGLFPANYVELVN